MKPGVKVIAAGYPTDARDKAYHTKDGLNFEILPPVPKTFQACLTIINDTALFMSGGYAMTGKVGISNKTYLYTKSR